MIGSLVQSVTMSLPHLDDGVSVPKNIEPTDGWKNTVALFFPKAVFLLRKDET